MWTNAGDEIGPREIRAMLVRVKAGRLKTLCSFPKQLIQGGTTLSSHSNCMEIHNKNEFIMLMGILISHVHWNIVCTSYGRATSQCLLSMSTMTDDRIKWICMMKYYSVQNLKRRRISHYSKKSKKTHVELWVFYFKRCHSSL